MFVEIGRTIKIIAGSILGADVMGQDTPLSAFHHPPYYSIF